MWYLSIDGRKEVTRLRCVRSGTAQGSYDLMRSEVPEVGGEPEPGQSYYVRGTFTHNNLDFSEDVLHLADLGFKQVSVEPVVGTGYGSGLRYTRGGSSDDPGSSMTSWLQRW